MANFNTPLPPRFLRTPEAARFVGLSGRTLEKHRTYGTGPRYRKIGGRVVYTVEDLQAWADIGLRQSTTDVDVGVVSPARRRAPAAPALADDRRPDANAPQRELARNDMPRTRGGTS